MAERKWTKSDDKRGGQRGFGAGITSALVYTSQDEVLKTIKVNPAEKAMKELEAKLLNGDIPSDRSAVDGLVYEA